MREFIYEFFNTFVIFYSGFIVTSYIIFLVLATKSIFHREVTHDDNYTNNFLRSSPYTPAISIVAPAYNEEKTIINNVESLMSLDYPNYEVVIVNDGSKDKTLELLMNRFQLTKVPYAYVEKVHTKPFRGVYKSVNPAFKKLTVVDKENGGTKADASNAGLNIVSTPYFVCTDVDCIIDKNALYRVIWPVMRSKTRMIAVSASMRMSNGCEVRNGQMIDVKPPHSLLPLFQDLEYTRSYLVGKNALAKMNAIQNVSGGFGLFDTEIAIAAGGYDGTSFAEDMDMVGRMIRYMKDSGQDYNIVQIPETCCWTEGPSTLKVFRRQRVRWGRGLLQFYMTHWDMVGKSRYGLYGILTLPYLLIFELSAPVIEAGGYLMIIYLFLRQAINYHTIWIVFATLYTFAQMMNLLLVMLDIHVGSRFRNKREYLWFMLASLLEPFIYHPINVFFSLNGYWNHLVGKKLVWGTMTRKGFAQSPSPQGARKS